MHYSTAISSVVVWLLAFLGTVDCLVIQNHWSHVRFKTLAPASVTLRQSSGILLTCAATGSPIPTVNWYHGQHSVFTAHIEQELSQVVDSSMGETVARMRLRCVGEAEEGEYECRARSGHHEVSAVTSVAVSDWDSNLCAEAGEPEIMMWRPTVMVEEGGSASLPCRVSTPGERTLQWTDHEGRAVDSRHSVDQDTGTLTISPVSFTDMGQYTCTVTNTHGKDSVTTFLYPLAPPRVP